MPAKKRISPLSSLTKPTKAKKKKATSKPTKRASSGRRALAIDPPIIVRLAGPTSVAAEAEIDPPIIVRGGSLAVELGKLDFEQIRVPRQPSKIVQTLTEPVRQLVLEDKNGVRSFHLLRSNQGCIVSISYTAPNASLDLPVNITIRGKKIEVDVAPLSFDDFGFKAGSENQLDHPISGKEITDVTVIYPTGEIDHYPIPDKHYAITFDTRTTNTLRQLAEQQA